MSSTEDRLSRNVDDVDFTNGINNQICRWGASKVLDEMVIAMDRSDIPKRFASKVAYLCGIRDGSEVGVKRDCCEMARSLPCDFKATLIKYEEGKEREGEEVL